MEPRAGWGFLSGSFLSSRGQKQKASEQKALVVLEREKHWHASWREPNT